MGSCGQGAEAEPTWSCALQCLNWSVHSSVRVCWVSPEHAVITWGVMLDAQPSSLCVSRWAFSMPLALEWRVDGLLVCLVCLFLAESTSKRGTWSGGILRVGSWLSSFPRLDYPGHILLKFALLRGSSSRINRLRVFPLLELKLCFISMK